MKDLTPEQIIKRDADFDLWARGEGFRYVQVSRIIAIEAYNAAWRPSENEKINKLSGHRAILLELLRKLESRIRHMAPLQLANERSSMLLEIAKARSRCVLVQIDAYPSKAPKTHPLHADMAAACFAAALSKRDED